MHLKTSDRFLYPGSQWQNDRTKATIYTASLDSVTFLTQESTIPQQMPLNEFMASFEPIVTSDHVVDALLQVLPRSYQEGIDPTSSYTSLAVKFLSILNAVNPDWYNDPDITYQLLRFGIEGVVAFELHATGKTGNGKDQLLGLVGELYTDVSSATDKIVVQLLSEKAANSGSTNS